MDIIDNLISAGYLKTPAIIKSFRKIKREDFLPSLMPQKKLAARINDALPIGYGQTISQPSVVAFMLELLNPAPGQKILDVGYGSGWTTALLANIVGAHNSKGKIIAIERIPELSEFGENNIDKYGFIKNGVVTCAAGDGSMGLDSEKPFDRILSSASAETIPEIWKKQLKIEGIIVSPVGNYIVKLTKTGKDDFIEENYYGFEFVPLILN